MQCKFGGWSEIVQIFICNLVILGESLFHNFVLSLYSLKLIEFAKTLGNFKFRVLSDLVDQT